MPNTLPTIEDRLAELETRLHALRRANRRIIAAAVAAAAFAALGFASHAVRSPEVLRAKRIQMVDDNERVRAELSIDAQGSAGLFVLDDTGLIRGTFLHDERQTALYLLDAEGTVRVGAAQFAHGGGGIALHGPDSKGAAVLLLKDNAGSLTFYDPKGDITLRTPDSAPRTAASPTSLPD